MAKRKANTAAEGVGILFGCLGLGLMSPSSAHGFLAAGR